MFSNEYYKEFNDLLVTPLCESLFRLLVTGEIPKESLEEVVINTQKPGKPFEDPIQFETSCQNVSNPFS